MVNHKDKIQCEKCKKMFPATRDGNGGIRVRKHKCVSTVEVHITFFEGVDEYRGNATVMVAYGVVGSNLQKNSGTITLPIPVWNELRKKFVFTDKLVNKIKVYVDE